MSDWTRQTALRTVRGGIPAGLVLTALLSSAPANAMPPFRGSVDVAAVQAEAGGDQTRTVRQDYGLRWSRELTPWIDLRLSGRYFRFDLDRAQTAESQREQLQPVGELRWNHPWFSGNVTARHRRTDPGSGSALVFNDNFSASIQSRSHRLPRLSLRFEVDRLNNEEDAPVVRDTRNRSFQFGVSHDLYRQSLSYDFSRRETENVISNQELEDDSSVLRWSTQGAALDDSRLRFTSNYSLDHRNRRIRRASSAPALGRITLAAGIFLDRSTPEFGELLPAPGLIDGNTQILTDPPIGLGGAFDNQNIGADLGFDREVAGIYLYTDRVGLTGSWTVWISRDNLSWTQITTSPDVVLNPTQQRYEILFSSTVARFVKVVNSTPIGLPELFVTEIEAFEPLDEPSLEQSLTGHRASAGIRYRVGRGLRSYGEFTFAKRPSLGLTSDRNEWGYSIGLRHDPAEGVVQDIRWNQSFQLEDDPGQDLTEDILSYALQVDPNQRLHLGLSLSARTSLLDGDTDRETRSANLVFRGTPIRTLEWTGSVTRSRSESFQPQDTRFDTWTYQSTADTEIFRTLDATLRWLHQRTTEHSTAQIRTRSTYGGELRWRPTNGLTLRASYRENTGISRSKSEDYGISWRLTPKLNASAQAGIDRTGNDFASRRYTARVDYGLSSRMRLYVGFSRSELSEVGGLDTTSFQQGMRTTF